MARLPQPGGDDGNWGSILNEYLSVAHGGDGAIKSGAIDSTALQDQTITPVKLSADNTPASGQVLSYNGSGFEWVTVSGGGIVNWGDINGTLSNQTDLQNALNGKADTAHTHPTSDIISGTLGVDRGGTGINSYTANNYIRATGPTTLEQRTPAQVRSDIGADNAGNLTSGTVALARLQEVLAFVDVVTGNEARPTGASRVIWIGGTAEPTNMANNDVWLEEVV